MSKSVLGDLPEGVSAAMFLRDGWPRAVVCKVLMKNGCIGIGLYRHPGASWPRPSPVSADQMALLDAINHVDDSPPDYSEIHDHVQRQREQAEARYAAAQYKEEPDVDLQAQLGQKAHE